MVILLNTNYTIGQSVFGETSLATGISALLLIKISFQIITPIMIIFISSINDNLVKEGYNNSYIGILVMALIPIGNINVFKDLINTFSNLWIRKFFGGNVETNPLCIENKYGKPDLSLILMLECINIIPTNTNQNINKNEITIKHGCIPIICLCIKKETEKTEEREEKEEKEERDIVKNHEIHDLNRLVEIHELNDENKNDKNKNDKNKNEIKEEDFILNNINIDMFIAWYRNLKSHKVLKHRATFHSEKETSNIWDKMPKEFIQNLELITKNTTLELIEKYIIGNFTFGTKINEINGNVENVAYLNYDNNNIIIKNIDMDVLKMLNKGDTNSTNEISFITLYKDIVWILVIIFCLIIVLICTLFSIIIKGQWVYLAMWCLLFFQTIAYIIIRPSKISANIPLLEDTKKGILQKKIFNSDNVNIKIKWINLNTNECDYEDWIDTGISTSNYNHRWLMYSIIFEYKAFCQYINLIVGIMGFITNIIMLILVLFCDGILWIIILFGFLIFRQIVLAIISNKPNCIIDEQFVNTLRCIQKDSIPGTEITFRKNLSNILISV